MFIPTRFFNSFVSFPEEELYGFDDDDALLSALAKKYGYDDYKFKG